MFTEKDQQIWSGDQLLFVKLFKNYALVLIDGIMPEKRKKSIKVPFRTLVRVFFVDNVTCDYPRVGKASC